MSEPSPPAQKGGEYVLMLASMVRRFQEWMDEISMREHGFRLSKLHNLESRIARLACIENPREEVTIELDRLLTSYRTTWLKRRQGLDDL